MKILYKVLTYLVLPVVIVVLAWLLVDSITVPVKFEKQVASRTSVAVQRLKDIRSLEVAFKSVHGRYTSSIDSLINFYQDGQMEVVMQIGSNDDSLAVLNTKALRKKNPRITPEQMYELHLKGANLVFSRVTKIPVKDTLFLKRTDFSIDSLKYIPFSGKQLVEMNSVLKQVSGVTVPLFEAKMPYESLLKGLNRQLVINLVDERQQQDRFPGLMVGSVVAPNNNAGNWE